MSIEVAGLAEQRLESLRRANAVRAYRAGLKVRLKAGESPLLALREAPPELATMRVIDLLLAIPKFGRMRAGRVLWLANLPPGKTVGGLTERQRSELLAAVAPYVGSVRRR